ncbi:MAG: hypothetical protein H7Y00_08160 [Fimbriimonadaceae bacterium]|nr:hypothetical protein [Chitinophagales bacterium]
MKNLILCALVCINIIVQAQVLTFSGYPEAVNGNLYGFHTAGFFTRFSEDDDCGDHHVWDITAEEVAPEVLRFPSGADGKFAEPDAAGGGYNYDLEDIEQFYDGLDGTVTSGIGTGIMDGFGCPCDPEDDSPGGCQDDLTAHLTGTEDFHDRIKGELIAWYLEWYKDAYGGTACTPSTYDHVGELCQLVGDIRAANPGAEPKIIICANIITMTATQVKDLVIEIKDILDVTYDYANPVIAVELGNELYSIKNDFTYLFNAKFNRYWTWVNGGDIYNGGSGYNAHIPGTTGTYNIKNIIIPSDVLSDHNYISVLKNYDPAIEIGLVAAPCPDCDDADDGGTGGGDLGDWNVDMLDKTDNTITVSAVAYKRFDGIIIHPYFTAKHYDEDVAELDDDCTDDDTDSEDAYTYGTGAGDADIQGYYDNGKIAFKKYLELSDDGGTNTQFIDLMDYYVDVLDLDNTTTQKLWLTEWNLKDHNNHEDIDKINLQIYNNTLLNAYLVNDYWLWQYRSTVASGYGDFIKYSIFHNLSGASNTCLFSSFDDQTEYDDIVIPCDGEAEELTTNEFFVQRISYYVSQVLKTIYQEELEYVPSSVVSPVTDITTTTFWDEISGDEGYLYVFYSNLEGGSNGVTLTLDGSSIKYYLLGGATTLIAPDHVDRTYVRGEQLYSTSGTSSIYCYSDYYESNVPAFEINSVTSDTHANFKLPRYSVGYIKIHVDETAKIGRENINCAAVDMENSALTFTITDSENNMQYIVRNLAGQEMFTGKVTGQTIDLSFLPTGINFYELMQNNQRICSDKFSVMY